MLESSQDSVITTNEGLFIVTTPLNSVTLLVTWHALVMTNEGLQYSFGVTSVLMAIQTVPCVMKTGQIVSNTFKQSDFDGNLLGFQVYFSGWLVITWQLY